jgi:hypothetical protein
VTGIDAIKLIIVENPQTANLVHDVAISLSTQLQDVGCSVFQLNVMASKEVLQGCQSARCKIRNIIGGIFQQMSSTPCKGFPDWVESHVLDTGN